MEIIFVFSVVCSIMAFIIAINVCIRLNKIEEQLLNKN